MRLVAFRVRNYKTIRDTGRIAIREHVGCFLGMNESGKSAVLQAIWKFNNANRVSYDFLYDYPKERYSLDRGTDPVVVELEFRLDAPEQVDWSTHVGPLPSKIAVSSTYSAKKKAD